MRILSYATLLDEYSEHNFCTGSLSSKALATESYHDYLERQSDGQTDKQTANNAASTVFKQNRSNSLTR